MHKAQHLHSSAMRTADQALAAKRIFDRESSAALFRDALKLEAQAATLTRKQPSRAILFRSAANLALECEDFDSAEQMACLGLIGGPPEDIAEELRNALDSATFLRHLRLDGITLGPASVQLAIAGPSVGHGDAPEPEIMARLDAYRKLVTRSANRKRSIAYSDSAPQPGENEDFRLYMSTPRAASFAVTLRVGARETQGHFSFDIDSSSVVEDVLTNLEHFEANREQALRVSIPDTEYRRNFIALAKKLAPDGERITTVGLTRTSDKGTKFLAMRQPKASHQAPRAAKSNSPIVTLDGRLSSADSPTKKKSGRIKLTTETTEYKIAVPKGMLSDIVRPHFDEAVKIRARKRSMQIYEFVEFVDK